MSKGFAISSEFGMLNGLLVFGFAIEVGLVDMYAGLECSFGRYLFYSDYWQIYSYWLK